MQKVRFVYVSILLCVSAIEACNSRPSVPGEHCFTPDYAFLTNISEVCELRQKDIHECYLRNRNNTKQNITCKQVEAMQYVAGQ